MGQEIERKYLINHKKWQEVKQPNGEFYRQGYLLIEPEKTIRIRLAGAIASLTIKGASIGAARAEYEYNISFQEATELLEKFSVSEITKTRYKIIHSDKTWEVDEFSGRNQGLIIAEIEINNELEAFDMPDWIEKEVTSDEKYYNSNLALKPFTTW